MIYDDKINSFLEEQGLDIYNFYESKKGQFVFNKYFYYNEELGVYVEVYDFDESFKSFQIAERIRLLESKFNKYLEDKKYINIFTLMEKGLRIQYLNKWYLDIPKDDLLEVFEFVYSSSEYGFEDIDEEILDIVKELFNNQNKFESIVTIYRGQTSKSQNYDTAYSWTLLPDIARFFANRFNTNSGKIYTAKVNKDDIIYYIDNNEQEILVNPDKIFDIKEI